MYQSLTEAFSKDMRAFRQYLKAYFPWIVIDFRRFQAFMAKRDPDALHRYLTDWDPYSVFDLDFLRMFYHGYLQASLPQELWEQMLVLGLLCDDSRISGHTIPTGVLISKVEPFWRGLSTENREALKETKLFSLEGGSVLRAPESLQKLFGWM